MNILKKIYSSLEKRKRETETETEKWNCCGHILPEPIFQTLIPSLGLNTWMITILLLLLPLQTTAPVVWQKDTSGSGYPPQKNSFHSFQTRMPIFRMLLSAVMAVGSLASFNPSLPQTSWLAQGMPLRSNPSSNSDYTAPPSPLKCWEGLCLGGAWVAAMKSGATR